MFWGACGTSSARHQRCNLGNLVSLLCSVSQDYWNLQPTNGCLRAELMSSAGPLLTPGDSTACCPINFKCCSYHWPPYIPSLSLVPPSIIIFVCPAQYQHSPGSFCAVIGQGPPGTPVSTHGCFASHLQSGNAPSRGR